ncbi:hypothetical protein BJY52DRAFT_330942 [Lactarius psammicola]|nr:hypothetical protein BJY52DRAFT_330942 [Lactarius psammicola]
MFTLTRLVPESHCLLVLSYSTTGLPQPPTLSRFPSPTPWHGISTRTPTNIRSACSNFRFRVHNLALSSLSGSLRHSDARGVCSTSSFRYIGIESETPGHDNFAVFNLGIAANTKVQKGKTAHFTEVLPGDTRVVGGGGGVCAWTRILGVAVYT